MSNDAAAAANTAPFAHSIESPPLQFGGGGGNSGGMDVVDAKIAAAEARTDAKFADLKGDLRVIATSTAGLKSTVIGTGLAVIALTLAAMAYGGQMFGTGMDAQTVADRAAISVEQRLQSQLETASARYDEMSARLDAMSAESSETLTQVLRALELNNAPANPRQDTSGTSP